MTREEILKGNELIGRFVGKSFPSGHISDFNGQLPIDINKKYLKYHKDWNQLIKAISKWDTLNIDSDSYSELCDIMDHAVTLYKINIAFTQLTECIKWYNQQKQQ